MLIEIDLDSPVPTFEQVRDQLAAYIDAEVLAPGDRLPSIRQLANDLGVATNTIQRAYRELEADGVIRARGRHGTVVSARTDGPDGDPATPAMREAAERLARETAASGGSVEDVIRAARTAFLRLGSVADPTLGGGAS